MKILTSNEAVESADREFVEQQLDELIEKIFAEAASNDERFSNMLAHLISISVAPSLAAANSVLRLPKVSARNAHENVRFVMSGESNYVGRLDEFQAELAEAVTNAVLQTILGPVPRIPNYYPAELTEEPILN
jgi:hypothetical protein